MPRSDPPGKPTPPVDPTRNAIVIAIVACGCGVYWLHCRYQIGDWTLAIIGYCSAVVISFIPVLTAILKKVQLNDGGSSFSESTHFSGDQIEILQKHYSRIAGTLGYWKNTVAKFQRFHYFCLLWTIPSSVLIPILTQAIGETENSGPKLLVTIMSALTATLMAFHRGFKVEDNFKAFRHGESEFYDIYRRMLDDPKSYGKDFDSQFKKYAADVATLRRFIRNAETNNLATLDDARESLKKNTQ